MSWTRVEDRLSAIAPLVSQAGAVATAAGLSPERSYELQVCLEEVLANLVLHGRPRGAAKSIRMKLSVAAGAVTLQVADRCHAFDPHAEPPRPPDWPLQLGGRGLGLLAAFAPDLVYRPGEPENELVIVFRETGPQGEPGTGAGGTPSRS